MDNVSEVTLRGCFKWVEETFQFSKDFIENNNEISDEWFFLEVDVQYFEKLHDLHNYWLFLPKRITIEIVQNVVANLRDKNEYVFQPKNLKQALNHGLVLKKVY